MSLTVVWSCGECWIRRGVLSERGKVRRVERISSETQYNITVINHKSTIPNDIKCHTKQLRSYYLHFPPFPAEKRIPSQPGVLEAAEVPEGVVVRALAARGQPQRGVEVHAAAKLGQEPGRGVVGVLRGRRRPVTLLLLELGMVVLGEVGVGEVGGSGGGGGRGEGRRRE